MLVKVNNQYRARPPIGAPANAMRTAASASIRPTRATSDAVRTSTPSSTSGSNWNRPVRVASQPSLPGAAIDRNTPVRAVPSNAISNRRGQARRCQVASAQPATASAASSTSHQG